MKKKFIIFGIFLILGLLILNKTLSELKPIPKVTFKSQILNYERQEPGSFKIDKSAKWIGEGKAKITIDVDSVLKENNGFKDIIFAIDISGSMAGDKIKQVKKDVTELASSVLSNSGNRAALITFDTVAEIVSGFTTNKEEFIKKVNGLTTKGETNYKVGFETVKRLLNGYKKEEGKGLALLFLTDGIPNQGTPNEVVVYNELRKMYPYININAVQYEMGKKIQGAIKAISERQFPADMGGLNKALQDASTTPIIYDNFVITDYISKHFKGEVSKIKASQGKAVLDGNKVTWNLGTYRTGTKATLEIELEKVGEKEDTYNTNAEIDIKTSLENQKDDQKSTATPILKDSYKVIYEANAPNGCVVKNLEATKEYRPYEKVLLSKENATCDGYLFQGYNLITDVKHINDDYIEMPEKDVVLKATWSKIKFNKSMQGKVARDTSIYNIIKAQSVGNDKDLNIDFKKANSNTNGEGVYLLDDTKSDENPVYFYRGTYKLNNNLIYGGFCWKIVRTTETGGVRIVYKGTPNDGKCESSSATGKSSFNDDAIDGTKKFFGYMYGNDANPYENINDSIVKQYLDKWYQANINGKAFESNIDKKSIYCGDRREEENKGEFFYFAGNDRLENGKPSFKCSLNDSYGVNGGNRILKYPVGLLTTDDVMVAGINLLNIMGDFNQNNYLNFNDEDGYMLMTPIRWDDAGYAYMPVINSFGVISSAPGAYRYGVRPAITIAKNALVISGTGSREDPYII